MKSTNKVRFAKLKKRYSINEDICLQYTVSGDHEVNQDDWIGLFEADSTEYLSFVRIPYPKNYVKGTEIEKKVIFPALKKQKYDGSLYRFRYIGCNRTQMGASKSFQINDVSAEDLIEFGSKDCTAVVNTKTMTEEKLQEEAAANNSLKQKIEDLESKLILLEVNNEGLKKALEERKNVAVETQKFGEILKKTEELMRNLQDKLMASDELKKTFENQANDVQSLKVEVDDKNEIQVESIQDQRKILSDTLSEWCKPSIFKKKLNDKFSELQSKIKKTFGGQEMKTTLKKMFFPEQTVMALVTLLSLKGALEHQQQSALLAVIMGCGAYLCTSNLIKELKLFEEDPYIQSIVEHFRELK